MRSRVFLHLLHSSTEHSRLGLIGNNLQQPAVLLMGHNRYTAKQWRTSKFSAELDEVVLRDIRGEQDIKSQSENVSNSSGLEKDCGFFNRQMLQGPNSDQSITSCHWSRIRAISRTNTGAETMQQVYVQLSTTVRKCVETRKPYLMEHQKDGTQCQCESCQQSSVIHFRNHDSVSDSRPGPGGGPGLEAVPGRRHGGHRSNLIQGPGTLFE